MEIVHKGAVEREVPWEPREEDVFETPITSNLVELKERESKLDVLFGGSWESI